MIGAARLVPPIVHQWLPLSGPCSHSIPVLSCTASPVYGSASAETSATARLVPHPMAGQPEACSCQEGAPNSSLQPPPPAPNPSRLPAFSPPSFQTVSPKYAPPVSNSSLVPPTATTCGEDAGYSTKPRLLAVGP